MKKMNENAKVTLTVGQIRKLVKESFEDDAAKKEELGKKNGWCIYWVSHDGYRGDYLKKYGTDYIMAWHDKQLARDKARDMFRSGRMRVKPIEGWEGTFIFMDKPVSESNTDYSWLDLQKKTMNLYIDEIKGLLRNQDTRPSSEADLLADMARVHCDKMRDIVDFIEQESTKALKASGREELDERAGDIVSQDDVNELVLYITNDSDLYHKWVEPIIANLRKKFRKGVYDPELAVVLWRKLADEGTRQYDKEFGSGKGDITWLNTPTRNKIAEELRDHYQERVEDEEA